MEREKPQFVRFASAFDGVEFEWDPQKNLANIRNHGVSFQTASLVFYDPNIVYRNDEKHSDAEQRHCDWGCRQRWRFIRCEHNSRR
jgi:uncharacterized DUF497 family protein